MRWRALVVLFVLALGWPPSVPAATPPTGPGVIAPTGHLIVGLRPVAGFDDGSGPIPRLTTSRLFPAAVLQSAPLGGNTYRLELAATTDATALLQQLLGQPAFRYVEHEVYLSLDQAAPRAAQVVTPNDPAWAGQEEMRRIEADRAWELSTGAPEAIIAILDTGVSLSHVDLAGRVLPGASFVTSRNGASDDEGHGTMTASVAAGAGNNRAGMAGVCWSCRILPLKVLDRTGRGSSGGFVAALRLAADQGARVANVSAGGPDRSQALEEAVEYAYGKGMLVVASAGNDPDTQPNYPAAYEHTLAVAASGPNDNVTSFSTRGPFVDLAAPGVNITGAQNGSRNGVVRASGTSFSAPLVTGAAGLLLSLRPALTLEQLRHLLTDTTLDIGAPGRDDNFGTGRLAVYDAALATASPAATGGIRLQATPDGLNPRVQLTANGFQPGEPLRLLVSAADGRTKVQRNLVADGAGNLNLTYLIDQGSAAGAYTALVVGDATRRIGRAEFNLVTARTFFQPVPASAASSRRYFPETGHSLGDGFRAYWETRGGLRLFGYPISEEFQELNLSDGKVYTVQYFERNRFEFHPELVGTGNEIQLGLLGALLTGDRLFPPVPAVPNTADRRYFAETRHTLSSDFLAYWQANGGLAIFGYPISEPYLENGRLVQYFERNRFELHPELPPAYRVSLGLLGVDLARRNSYAP